MGNCEHVINLKSSSDVVNTGWKEQNENDQAPLEPGFQDVG